MAAQPLAEALWALHGRSGDQDGTLWPMLRPGVELANGEEISKKTSNCELVKACCRKFDVFRGVLVVLMTYAHVDLCLLSPVLQYYAEVPHMVGNMASGLCFLGFMLSYGFTCDIAYLSDKDRPWSERLNRVARSIMLPVCAAWICCLAWGFMCFNFLST